MSDSRDTSQQLLDQLASRCRSAYIRERESYEHMVRGRPAKFHPGPRWDGGKFRDGKTYKAIWPDMAKFMLRNNLDPESCIRYRFMMQSSNILRPVYPNQIANRRYLQDYVDLSKQEQQDIASRFEFEKSFGRSRIVLEQHLKTTTMQESTFKILVDETLPLSALFRYSLARSMKMFDVCRRYRLAAIAQYLEAPDEYDEIWREWLPACFKENARAVAEAILYRETNETRK